MILDYIRIFYTVAFDFHVSLHHKISVIWSIWRIFISSSLSARLYHHHVDATRAPVRHGPIAGRGNEKMKVAFGWCSRRFKSTIQAFRYNKFSLISTFLYIIFFWRHNLTGCRIGLEFSRLIPPFSVALFLIYSCLLVATCLLEIPC